MRCFVAASYADAIRKSVGSEKGLPKNMIPTGSFAGIGPPGAYHHEPWHRGPYHTPESRNPPGPIVSEYRAVPAGPRLNSSCLPVVARWARPRCKPVCSLPEKLGRRGSLAPYIAERLADRRTCLERRSSYRALHCCSILRAPLFYPQN